MKSIPSPSVAPAGDWLVVIDRLEACVFRSTLAGAASQCIRAQLAATSAGTGPPGRYFQNGRELSRPPGFFEPLAAVLHGARRILMFGRATALGDETAPFVFWLCHQHPEIARRIVGSMSIEPRETSESTLLAKARAFYHRLVITTPEAPGRGLPSAGRHEDLAR